MMLAFRMVTSCYCSGNPIRTPETAARGVAERSTVRCFTPRLQHGVSPGTGSGITQIGGEALDVIDIFRAHRDRDSDQARRPFTLADVVDLADESDQSFYWCHAARLGMVSQSVEPTDDPMRESSDGSMLSALSCGPADTPLGSWPRRHNATIDREARLDQILLALWHGRLTAEAAADRIVAEVGMPHHRARAEVEGFLRD
jgi:hypothetical protein